jgi:hypothetical protein
MSLLRSDVFNPVSQMYRPSAKASCTDPPGDFRIAPSGFRSSVASCFSIRATSPGVMPPSSSARVPPWTAVNVKRSGGGGCRHGSPAGRRAVWIKPAGLMAGGARAGPTRVPVGQSPADETRR